MYGDISASLSRDLKTMINLNDAYENTTMFRCTSLDPFPPFFSFLMLFMTSVYQDIYNLLSISVIACPSPTHNQLSFKYCLTKNVFSQEVFLKKFFSRTVDSL